MCFAKGNPGARSPVRLAKLSVFLREHLRLGDEPDVEMEGSRCHNEGKDGSGNTERRAHLHEVRQVFFYQLCGPRQDFPDAVQSLAERAARPANDGAGNVAVGGCFLFCALLFLPFFCAGVVFGFRLK